VNRQPVVLTPAHIIAGDAQGWGPGSTSVLLQEVPLTPGEARKREKDEMQEGIREEDEGEIDESLLTHSMCLAHVDE